MRKEIKIHPSVTRIVDMQFFGSETQGPLHIPKLVKIIGSEAFARCYNLTRVHVPDSVEIIGRYSFSHCASLCSVHIGNSVKWIRAGAFSDCYKLANLEFPDSLEEIGNNAFDGCKSLTSVRIPASVLKIGEQAFANCPDLKVCQISETTKFPPWSFPASCEMISPEEGRRRISHQIAVERADEGVEAVGGMPPTAEDTAKLRRP